MSWRGRLLNLVWLLVLIVGQVRVHPRKADRGLSQELQDLRRGDGVQTQAFLKGAHKSAAACKALSGRGVLRKSQTPSRQLKLARRGWGGESGLVPQGLL